MTLTHHILPARSGQTRSLVVLLHGFGSQGQDMLGLARTLSMALPDTTFLVPDAPDAAPGRPGGCMWYTIPELGLSTAAEADLRLQASARKLDTFLDDQLAAHGLPAAAMALLGISQGAGLAYEVAPRRRDQLAGVVAISGRMKRKGTLAAEVGSKPPFLILNGAKDNLLSTDETAQTATALSQVGIPAMRIIMAGVGHGISDDGIGAARDFLKSVLHAAT
ncbi:MAG: dienelactone hydrolase family protein [Tabrizicola sp.]|jgi:phospholipase/carboxylesterase|nr:dienelactone hydrolase family protein [Tabrizicola sp.]